MLVSIWLLFSVPLTLHAFSISFNRALSSPAPPDNPPGNSTDGWESLPKADGTLYQYWHLNSTGGSIPVYLSKNRKLKDITRAVVVLSGARRDCWYHFNVFNDALIQAARESWYIEEDEISLMAPCFLDLVDLDAGAARGKNLVWNDTSWISGDDSLNSGGPKNVSSFEALDQLLDYYLDRDTYPKLKASSLRCMHSFQSDKKITQSVMVTGHSAGGQMAQRYAMLKPASKDDKRTQFWIANPASFVWLTANRPDPNPTCLGFDEYKYGLNGSFPRYVTASETGVLSRSRFLERYSSRYIHYNWATLDYEIGDFGCQAMVQGAYHLDRGKNWVSMLQELPKNITARSTVTWIKNVGHDVEAIMQQKDAWDRVFRYLPPT